jgi:hypothetical protein
VRKMIQRISEEIQTAVRNGIGLIGSSHRPILVCGILVIGFALASCGQIALPQGTSATATKPSVHVEVTHAPNPEAAVTAYYSAWQQGDFAGIYQRITAASQRLITPSDFEKYYADIHAQATLRSVDYQVQTLVEGDGSAIATIQQTWHTILVGDITRLISLPLKREAGDWKIDWSFAVVLPELAGGNRLSMMRQPAARGTIYDRNSQPLAYQTEVISIGLVPGEISDPDKVDGRLGQIFGRTKGQIHALYDGKDPNGYIPVGYLSKDELAENYGALADLNGVQVNSNSTRYYAGDGIASLLVGYTGQPSAEEVASIRALVYAGDE